MIKKIALSLVALVFIFSSTLVLPKNKSFEITQKKLTKEEKKRKKELKKKLNEEKGRLEQEKKKKEREQKKLEKKLKKEHKKREREEEKARERAKKSTEKAKRAGKKAEGAKKQHAATLKKQENKKQHVWSRMFNKKRAGEEKLRIKAEQKDGARIREAERKEERYMTALERKNLADEKRRIRREKLQVEKDLAKVEREKFMFINKMERKKDVEMDYAQGYYADLYKRPAWPFEMFYADQKDIFQVSMKSDYATDAYTSGGSTADLTALPFGERSFEFQDLLLAVKLAKKGILNPIAFGYNAAAGFLFNTYYNKKLVFYGKSNEFDVSLDFARYVWGKNALLGVRVPVGYRSHRLKLDSDLHAFGEAYLSINGWPNHNVNFSVETMLAEMLNYAIAPKNLSYLPKSSITGLGDISTFLNFQFQTRYVERFIAGIDVLWPTAKSADQSKLWAPKLGNDFTKVSLFMSVLFNHQRRCFNPHMFLKGTYQVPGHKNRRVPEIITHTEDVAEGTTLDSEVAHGCLVQFRTEAQQQATHVTRFFTEPDTTIPAFADNVKSVDIRPGCEVELRIGNIVEQFIWRRAFLDLFYNFRAKWRDHIGNSDLPRDEWDADVLKYQTNQLEHKIGLDFTYQIDAKSRFQLGFNYAFAGINVPVTLEGTAAVNVEF